MEDIIIDEEFKGLLPMLDSETLKLLEENIIENGCRDSLVLWNNILIDGHNRYEICTRLDIPFNTVSKEFDSREEAKIWIITTQVSRRNLNPKQLSHYRGLHYRAEKSIHGGSRKRIQESSSNHNDYLKKNQRTVEQLSERYKVSPPTIQRDAKASEGTEAIGEASAEAMRMILAEEVKIEKKDLITIAAMSKEEVAEIARQIEEGKYEKKKPEKPEAAASAATESAASGYASDGNASDGHVSDGHVATGNAAAEADGSESNMPASIDFTGLQPPGAAVIRVADDFVYYSNLLQAVHGADTTELKMALRFFIDMLEDLHGKL